MNEYSVGVFTIRAFPRPQDGEVCYIIQNRGGDKPELRAKLEDLLDLQYAITKAIRIMTPTTQ